MKDPQMKEWLEHRFGEVMASLDEHNENDQLDNIAGTIETLKRCHASIEARLSIWSAPYPPRYVPPWLLAVSAKPEVKRD